MRKMSEKGQGMVEYALILVLTAVVVVVVLYLIGPSVGNIFSNILERSVEEGDASLVMYGKYCNEAETTCIDYQEATDSKEVVCPGTVLVNDESLFLKTDSCMVKYQFHKQED